MANVANNSKLVRVNINLPVKLVERVKQYADSLGLPYTQTYVLLLNNALNNANVINQLPDMLSLMSDIKEQQQLLINDNRD